MWNKIKIMSEGIGAVVLVGFILGSCVGAFLLPIFATWKLVFGILM